MGDVIVLKARQRRHFKFVYKRKIYLPSQFGESNDPAFERITYLQAEDEAINLGNVTPADQAAALELGAVSLYAALGDDFTADAGDLEAMDAPPFTDFLPPAFRETVNASQLVALRGPLGIAAAEGDEAAQESLVADLQRKFVRTCAELPLYAAGVRNYLGERRGPCGLIFGMRASPSFRRSRREPALERARSVGTATRSSSATACRSRTNPRSAGASPTTLRWRSATAGCGSSTRRRGRSSTSSASRTSAAGAARRRSFRSSCTTRRPKAPTSSSCPRPRPPTWQASSSTTSPPSWRSRATRWKTDLHTPLPL